MKSIRQKNFTPYLGTLTALTLLLASNTVLAQQITATGGITVDKIGGSFANINGTATGSAAYATGAGSTIDGSGLVITAGGFATAYMVTAANGGLVNLINGTTLSGGNGLITSGLNSKIAMIGGSITGGNTSASVAAGGMISLTDVAITSGAGTVSADGIGAVLNLKNGSIASTNTSSASSVLNISNGAKTNIDGTAFSTAAANSAAIFVARATLDAKNFNINTAGSSSYGINANSASTSTLANGTIHTKGEYASGIWGADNSTVATANIVTADHLTIVTEGANARGIFAGSNNTFTLTNSDITVNSAYGLYAQNYYNVANGGNISFSNGSITVNGVGGTGVLAVTSGSRIDLDTVAVKTTADSGTGLYSYSSALLTAKNTTVTTQGEDSYGLFVGSGATATLTNTTIDTSGADAYGLVFYGVSAQNTISVTGGSVKAHNGAAVVANGGTDVLNLKDTTVSGAGLMFAAVDYNVSGTVAGAKLSVSADNTTLIGGARMSALATNNVTLQNGSTWTLTPATDGGDSVVTSLNVNNSTVAFAAPTANNFQTLTTGAWNANGATLNMNTLLNTGGALANQQTDRLLINGNVTGTTQVSVTGVAGSPGGGTSLNGQNLAIEGISLIQVAGTSTANAFQLAGGYTTMGGMPYQYTLHAYGQGSTNGAADVSQRLVAGSGDYWDYRLQSVYVEPPVPTPFPAPSPGPGPSPAPAPVPVVRAVAPQVPSYIIAPTALFQAQLQDISNLHDRLGEIRSDRASGRNGGTGEFFIRAYGGSYDYNSNRNAYSYGYDANIDYAAMQLGGNLYAFENGNSVTRFGISGTLGSLSFDPKNVGNASKGAATTWSVAAHATYLHDSGFYVDGILSYGAFDGKVSTNLRGKTASLTGQSFAASVEAGYPIKLGYGLTLEPQAQIIYQRLMFDRTRDVDNFAVALGDQDQVLGRVGARLTKSFEMGKDQTFTLYAKANVLHAFSSGGTVFLGDTFSLGRFGTAIEGGIGVNATFAKNLSLYGDVAYQQKIGQSGVSGISLTGGLRYAF